MKNPECLHEDIEADEWCDVCGRHIPKLERRVDDLESKVLLLESGFSIQMDIIRKLMGVEDG